MMRFHKAMTLVVVALVAVVVVVTCTCPDEDLENFGAAARLFVRAAPAAWGWGHDLKQLK